MAKGAYIGVGGVARKIKKGYVGVPIEAVPDGEPVVTNLYNKNGVIDVDYQGAVRSDLVYKNDDGTVTIKSNYNTLVYGQNLYGRVKEGHAYTFACDVVSATIAQVHIAMDCMKDGARHIEYEGFTAVSAGAKIARTFTVPSGCTAVVFGIANPTTDTSQYVVVSNVEVVEGAYTADNIPTAVFSVARKIKKAYIGIGGVARPCWSGGELAYYGTVTGLSVARQDLAAASNKNYALFAGGLDGSSVTDWAVEAYSPSLTRSLPTELISVSRLLAGTSIGDYALFGGGYNGSSYLDIVTAYNGSLTRSQPTGLVLSSSELAATKNEKYALFGGGNEGGKYLAKVSAYNENLTQSIPSNFAESKRQLAAAKAGEFALFGGGIGSSLRGTVDAYDSTLTRSVPSDLSEKRRTLAGTSVSDYALFGGGLGSSTTKLSIVDAYDSSLTRTSPTVLTTPRNSLAATSIGDYALFGGGAVSSNPYVSDLVDVYDKSLTKTVFYLSAKRYALAATSIGDYALFGGGYGPSATSKVVEAFTVA